MLQLFFAIALCLVPLAAEAAMTIRASPGSAWSDPSGTPPCPKITQTLTLLKASSLLVKIDIQAVVNSSGVVLVPATPGKIEIKTSAESAPENADVLKAFEAAKVVATCPNAITCSWTWFQRDMVIGGNVAWGKVTMPNACWAGIGGYIDRK